MTGPDDLQRLAFEHAPVGLVLTENRVIRALNKTFARMIGYRKRELLGQSFRMLYDSRDDFEKMRDIGLRALTERRDYCDERLMLRRDGSRIWCRFRAHTLTPDAPLNRMILSYALLSDTLPAPALTRRERQVVSLLARGMTSKEAARELALSPRTVEDVRARLLRKFGTRNTAELVARFTGLEI